jgi:hypothetical protein
MIFDAAARVALLSAVCGVVVMYFETGGIGLLMFAISGKVASNSRSG